MKDAISILKSEHRSISAVLHGLKELARMAQEAAVRPDFRVLRSMIRYIDEYPERLHHPKEDEQLFARLLQRAPESRLLIQALQAAKADDRPSLIVARTNLGYGSPKKQDTFGAHGEPLGPEEVKATKRALGWPEDPPFHLPEQALAAFRTAQARGTGLEAEWQRRIDAHRRADSTAADGFARALAGELPQGWDAQLPAFAPAGVQSIYPHGEEVPARKKTCVSARGQPAKTACGMCSSEAD